MVANVRRSNQRRLSIGMALLLAWLMGVPEGPAMAQTIDMPGAMPLKAAWIQGNYYKHIELPIGASVSGDFAEAPSHLKGSLLVRVSGKPGQRLRLQADNAGLHVGANIQPRMETQENALAVLKPSASALDHAFTLPANGIAWIYYYAQDPVKRKMLKTGRYAFRIVDADAPAASQSGAIVAMSTVGPVRLPPSKAGGPLAILAGGSTFQEYPVGKTVKLKRDVAAGERLDLWVRPRGNKWLSASLCFKPPSGPKTCTQEGVWEYAPVFHMDYTAQSSGPLEISIKTNDAHAKSYTVYIAPLATSREANLAALQSFDKLIWKHDRKGEEADDFLSLVATPTGLRYSSMSETGRDTSGSFDVGPDGRITYTRPDGTKSSARLVTAGSDGSALLIREIKGGRAGFATYPDGSMRVFEEQAASGSVGVQLDSRKDFTLSYVVKQIVPTEARTVIADARTRYAAANAERKLAQAKADEEKRIAEAKAAAKRKQAFAILKGLMAKRWIYTQDDGRSALLSLEWQKPNETIALHNVLAENIAGNVSTLVFVDPVTGVLGAQRAANGQWVQATSYTADAAGVVTTDYDWGTHSGRVVYAPNGTGYDLTFFRREGAGYVETTRTVMTPIDDAQWAALHQASQNIINARNAEQQRAQDAQMAQAQAENDAYWAGVQAQWQRNQASSGGVLGAFNEVYQRNQARAAESQAIINDAVAQGEAIRRAAQAQQARVAAAQVAQQQAATQRANTEQQRIADQYATQWQEMERARQSTTSSGMAASGRASSDVAASMRETGPVTADTSNGNDSGSGGTYILVRTDKSDVIVASVNGQAKAQQEAVRRGGTWQLHHQDNLCGYGAVWVSSDQRSREYLVSTGKSSSNEASLDAKAKALAHAGGREGWSTVGFRVFNNKDKACLPGA